MSSKANEILAQFQHTFSDVFSPSRPSGGDLDTYSPGKEILAEINQQENALTVSMLRTSYPHPTQEISDTFIENPDVITARSTEEDLFHHLIQSHYQHYRLNPADNIEEYAAFADKMAQFCQLKYEHLSKSLHVQPMTTKLHTNQKEGSSANELRAERDLWNLLQMMSSADVLKAIDEKTCQEQLKQNLDDLPIEATIPDFINVAFQVDDRLKKGEIVRSWLERSVQDLVQPISVPSLDPCYDTCQAITQKNTGKHKTKLLSIHPDAQLTKDGAMLALAGDDKADQEALWSLIWQLIRSGQLEEAQRVAHSHRVYWLAASLRGVDNHYYSMISSDQNQTTDMDMDIDDVVISRIGNLRQPVWTKTCWKYAENLSKNASNWKTSSQPRSADSTSVGLLEMSIYASLANHTQVLLQSSFIKTWHDRMWVYMKACYQRDINQVVHRYRQRKSEHSAYYPACNQKVIDAETHVMQLLDLSLHNMSVATCDSILQQVTVPSSLNAESIIITLQATFIQGFTGLQKLLDSGIWWKWIDRTASYPGQDTIQRILCHVLLWIRFSPKQCNDQLRSLITEELFYKTLEAYIQQCIARQHYHVVGSYCVYLNRHRRIQSYANLLLAIQRINTVQEVQQVESNRALRIAESLFAEDVIEITRTVVSGTTSEDNSQALVLALPPPLPQGSTSMREEVIDDGALILPPFLSPGSSIAPRQRQTPVTTAVNTSHLQAIPSSAKLWFEPLHAFKLQDSEKMRMESLRWLLVEKEHVFEALSQGNRLLVSFLNSSSCERVGLLHKLLSDYLSPQLKEVGDDVLSDLYKSSQEEVQQILKNTSNFVHTVDGGYPAEVELLQRMIETKAGMWQSDTTKLHFWHRLLEAIKCLQLWSEKIGSFYQQYRMSVGDSSTVARCCMSHYGGLKKIGEDSVEILKSLIDYTTDENMEAVRGYKELWELAHVAARSRVEIVLQNALASLVEATNMNPPSNMSSCDDRTLLEECNQVMETILSLLPSITNETYPTDRIVADIEQIQSQLSSSLETALILQTCNTLKEALGLVQEIVQEQMLQGRLLKVILSTYLQVCHEMATCMSMLEREEDQCKWYNEAVEFSEVIAAEDHFLQLYTLLNPDDLEEILQEINRAAMLLLDLHPEFVLPNSNM